MFEFLRGPVDQVAPLLLGCELEREVNGQLLRGRIVEVEAYDQADMASHSYKGRTPRTEVMFGRAGHLYVYFTYGMHYCCNIVTGAEGHGAGVLIRSIEPIEGESVMVENRHGRGGRELADGPAKVCQALAIDQRLNGHDLERAPLRLIVRPPLASSDIIVTPRIGISRAVDMPWRFMIAPSVNH